MACELSNFKAQTYALGILGVATQRRDFSLTRLVYISVPPKPLLLIDSCAPYIESSTEIPPPNISNLQLNHNECRRRPAVTIGL
jgi:hypothetical protein